MRVAVYPGSFDPITNGHLDIIGRAVPVFDRVVVAVLRNPRKEPLLAADTRAEVIRATISGDDRLRDNVDVETFEGLTVDACRRLGARWIVRGLRALGDFDVEIQLAHNNRKLAPEIDTVFFMTALEHGYISSTLVREIALFGGDVSELIPPAALDAIRAALGR
ncbi:MAG: pantetheine-phosphate adenylyltransferase [Chloroflexota bacterium]